MEPKLEPKGFLEKQIKLFRGEVGLLARKNKILKKDIEKLHLVAEKIKEKQISWDTMTKELEIISNFKLEQSEQKGSLLDLMGYATTVSKEVCLEMNAKFIKDILGIEKYPNKYTIIAVKDGQMYLDRSRKLLPSHIIPEGGNELIPLGSGTEKDPYQIWFIDQLLYVDKDSTNGQGHTRSACYKLMRSLDFRCIHHYINSINKEKWTKNKGWYPLGAAPMKATQLSTHESAKVSFAGIFDGNNKEIRNLYINRPDFAYQAFFGQANGAKIKNIVLPNVNVTGQGYAGGIVGQSDYSKLKHCIVFGRVKGSYATGGLIGYHQNQSILTKSLFSGEVNGEFYTGGAIGIQNGGTVRKTFVLGSVNGKQYTGGFMGQSVKGDIDNSYTEAIVNALEKECGGFIGQATENTDINNCYSMGDIKGEKRVGEFAGDVSDNTTVKNCVSLNTIIEGDSHIADNFIGHKSMCRVETSGRAKDLTQALSRFKREELVWEERDGKMPGLKWFSDHR